ncbi:MAG: response regulator transcription factor [Candidatus Nanopelagicales bacterium]|nr:response regulator transcription factor [Candidatus Nanopelagicales bacterium]MCF8537001.1 response regulator transcription factor [Candidatus Nanopelagicales bacterium]
MSVTVLVVEDSDFTRMLLVNAVTSLGHACVEASTANDAVIRARESGPDVALVDLDLGVGPTGADLARALRSTNPRIGIAILTSYEDPRLLGNLPEFPVGALYMTKGHLADLGSLAALIDECATRPVTPRSVSTRVALSDSQLEVMRLVSAGNSNAEVAKELWLSVSAVEKAIHRLSEQLGLPQVPAANKRVLIAQAYYGWISDGRNAYP